MGGWCHIGCLGVWWQVGWMGWLREWVDGWVFEWMGGWCQVGCLGGWVLEWMGNWCHMDIIYTDQFQKLSKYIANLVGLIIFKNSGTNLGNTRDPYDLD